MISIPYHSLDEIERSRAEMEAFKCEIEDLMAEEAEIRALDDFVAQRPACEISLDEAAELSSFYSGIDL